MWATAVAITVWRQFPEYFELLETYYEKAMLHADENVLRIVRSVLQFDALDQIRPFKSDEARIIREQLAREAAAKHEIELNEELKVARMREEEVRIGKLSLVHARRLPMSTQQLFVAELGSEITTVFSALPPTLMQEQDARAHGSFHVGQLVESCRRRRKNGSVLATTNTSPRWHVCRISAVDEESCLVQLDFLDGECERERRIPMKYVRPTATGAQEARAAQFEALKRSWSQPIECEAEIARLEEARAVKLKPLPWDSRHHLALQESSSSKDEDAAHKDAVDRTASDRRPRSSARRPASRASARVDMAHPVDALFQAAAVVLMRYDRAYARVQAAIEAGARRYAAAVLYRERFHAFDELTDALVALVESTVDALEAIWRWKQGGSADVGGIKTFVWKGDDFVATLVRSLDFLGGYRELTEWYGEEFPLDGNPFMRSSSSLLDRAEERGLQPAEPRRRRRSSALRAALKLHKRSDDDPAATSPTWWPEARYSGELLHGIELAEQRVLADLFASRWLEKRRADQTVGP
ncbi:Amino Acid-Polyamine-Organocation (APC) Family [Phytophthora cinnamomi]|uniref:Amino Acid-Polyamine-Organocation (APC) Family n=1 Tax=Phytophthora cinnamomi TaxID=4785 RepID=UPI00355A87F6|nr:Amino Acid-Polyamine-Organocation (APC) Family [Phytophthora cinnamomi]